MAARSVSAQRSRNANTNTCISSLASREEALPAKSIVSDREQLASSSAHDDHAAHLQNLCERGDVHSSLRALSCTHTPLSSPNYLSLLKASIKSKFLPLAQQTKAHLASYRVPLHGVLGDYLVMALAKCGSFDEALSLSSILPRLSVFSWTSIIAAYVDHGHGLQALTLWQNMQEAGVEPDSFTLVSLFKGCGSMADIHQGRNLHALARRKGLASNIFVGNAILCMYAKCGAFQELESSFGEMGCRTTASWNILLSAALELGQDQEVLERYQQMKSEGVEPDSFTFVSLFKACSSIPHLSYGKELHVHVSQDGRASNRFVGHAILSMYRKCGVLSEAEGAFDALSSRDAVSWSSMISAYIEQDEAVKALCLYRQMQEEGVHADQATLSTALQACSFLAKKADDPSAAEHRARKHPWLDIGHALHSQVRRESTDPNILTSTSILTMYAKYQSIEEAENVFSTLESRDLVAWNAMLAAYVGNREGDRALLLYAEMQKQGIAPNDITFATVLQACTILKEKQEASGGGLSSRVIALEMARSLHTDICVMGLETYLPIANTLVSTYGKLHSIIEAGSMFGSLPNCDIVTWNVVLGAFRSSGQEEAMLHVYEEIQHENVALDEVSYISIIQACAGLGNLEACKQVHFDVLSRANDRHLAVATTLIDAYGSCAATIEAGLVFDNIPEPNVVSWNARIGRHTGQWGVEQSLHTLELMLSSAGAKPDAVSLTEILSVCSHAGLVVEGIRYFEAMVLSLLIPPEQAHFKLLIDLLGRAEDFRRIEHLLQRMPKPIESAIWWCVLDACCARGNFALGEQALHQVLSSCSPFSSNTKKLSTDSAIIRGHLGQGRHRELANDLT